MYVWYVLIVIDCITFVVCCVLPFGNGSLFNVRCALVLFVVIRLLSLCVVRC